MMECAVLFVWVSMQNAEMICLPLIQTIKFEFAERMTLSAHLWPALLLKKEKDSHANFSTCILAIVTAGMGKSVQRHVEKPS